VKVLDREVCKNLSWIRPRFRIPELGSSRCLGLVGSSNDCWRGEQARVSVRGRTVVVVMYKYDGPKAARTKATRFEKIKQNQDGCDQIYGGTTSVVRP